jgi:replicative DNA helicase
MKTVLSSIFPDNTERLFYLQEKTEDEFFSGTYLDLWRLVNKISAMTGGLVASEHAIRATLDHALNLPIERRAAIEDTLQDLVQGTEISEVDFRASVAFLEEEYRRNKLGTGLSSALEILTTGVHQGKELSYGVDPAIESLYATIADIEQSSFGAMPEGNVFEELSDLMKELEEGNTMERVPTGIRPFDEMTIGGIGLGELWLIMAYAGVGKTMFCINLAYHMAVMEGKNVVYITAETLRSQVRSRALTRHSHHPKFGIPNGLSSSTLKKREFTAEQKLQWKEVIKDFGTPQDGRGTLHISQIALGTKVSNLQAKLNKLNSISPIDMVIIDSLDLLAPEVPRSTDREKYNSIFTAAKLLATSFDNGRGLRIVSPWQVSRTGLTGTETTGRLQLKDLADTADAERKADGVLGLLADPNNAFKLKAQPIKFRDGGCSDFELEADYDRCYVGSNDRAGSSLEAALTGAFDI